MNGKVKTFHQKGTKYDENCNFFSHNINILLCTFVSKHLILFYFPQVLMVTKTTVAKIAYIYMHFRALHI